jgi:hypothetical protein
MNARRRQMRLRLKIITVGVMLTLCFVVSGTSMTYSQGREVFNNPMIEGYRLDWCLHWGKQCGKAAANAWCSRKMGKADGYAIRWEVDADIGVSSPTYVIADEKVCDRNFCDGFKWIECGSSLD